MSNDESNSEDAGVEQTSELPPWELADRPRGILTKTDRELLLGERDIQGQDLRNARYRVRQRIIASLHDVIALSVYLDSEEFTQISENEGYDKSAIEALGALAYKLLLYDTSVRSPAEEFGQKLGERIRLIEADRIDLDEHPTRSVKVSLNLDIEMEDMDLDAIQKKLLTGDASVEEAIKFQEFTERGGDRHMAREKAIKIVADEVGVEYEPDLD